MEDPTLCSLDSYWQRLPSASQRVLLLDYDGTLAPFHRERDKALPYPGVREILGKIQQTGQTRLIIITGRSIKDIIPLLGLACMAEYCPPGPPAAQHFVHSKGDRAQILG